MSEIRNISTIQDNLLLCYDLAKLEDGVRNIDYIYISKFLSSLSSEELMSLWTNSITTDYISDLDLVYDLCKWIIPKLEELEWYESCHNILKVTDDCKLYLANFPNI
jgi:hypothetical protein